MLSQKLRDPAPAPGDGGLTGGGAAVTVLEKHCGFPADVYSLGMLLLAILTGHPDIGDFREALPGIPSQPPAEVTGTVERRWILGGRFIQESVQGEYKSKTFEGLGLLGYDNAQKKFTTVRACGLCGTISQGLATCDGSGTKFVCAKEECCPLTGQKIQGRDEILVENHDRIVMNMYRTVQGKEVKAMEIVSIRKR